ncbi:MAG: phage major tail protein, TP901-1 family [Hyphomicrobiaceae bacterium]|nr:phage major tail protein, TP901-1 family [Hyphomicrobiaceae bacterium]
MAMQKGRDLLLKVADGAGFQTIAGLRARSLAFGASLVDATDADSPGQWRALLSAASERRARLSGSGLFRDAASDALLRQAFFAGTAPVMQVIVPDFGTLEGAFQIVELAYSGRHDDVLAFEITLESAGELTFTEA